MDVQSKINELWNEAAPAYDEQPRHGLHSPEHEAAWRDALRSLLPPPPADVLDVGTGTGMLALLLADLGYRVQGIDLAEKMLDLARTKAEALGLSVAFELGDAIDPPGEPDSFDMVVSRHVLWTLTDPGRALENWLRLLREGGRTVIIDGLWFAKGGEDKLGGIAPSLPLARAVTVDDVCDLVRSAGYVDVVASHLVELDRIERELSGEQDTEPRYVITGAKPA